MLLIPRPELSSGDRTVADQVHTYSSLSASFRLYFSGDPSYVVFLLDGIQIDTRDEVLDVEQLSSESLGLMGSDEVAALLWRGKGMRFMRCRAYACLGEKIPAPSF